MKTFIEYHIFYLLIIVALLSWAIYSNQYASKTEETFKEICWLFDSLSNSMAHSVELLHENTDFNSENPDASEGLFRRIVQLDLPLQSAVLRRIALRILSNPEATVRVQSKLCVRSQLLNAGIFDYYKEQDMAKNLRQTKNLQQGFILFFSIMFPEKTDIQKEPLYLKIDGQEPILIPSSKRRFVLDFSYHSDCKVYGYVVFCKFEESAMREEYFQVCQNLGEVNPVILPQHLLKSTDWIKSIQLLHGQNRSPQDVEIFDFPLSDM